MSQKSSKFCQFDLHLFIWAVLLRKYMIGISFSTKPFFTNIIVGNQPLHELSLYVLEIIFNFMGCSLRNIHISEKYIICDFGTQFFSWKPCTKFGVGNLYEKIIYDYFIANTDVHNPKTKWRPKRKSIKCFFSANL